MNTGKTIFTQLMDCLPWSTFARLVARHRGDHVRVPVDRDHRFRSIVITHSS